MIGVEDDGTISGLAHDLKLLGNSIDRFQQLLTALISENIGAQFSQLIKIRFGNMNEDDICVIDVEKSPEPVYLKGSKGKEFFIRVGNTTRALDPEQTVNFINMNWNYI